MIWRSFVFFVIEIGSFHQPPEFVGIITEDLRPKLKMMLLESKESLAGIIRTFVLERQSCCSCVQAEMRETGRNV